MLSKVLAPLVGNRVAAARRFPSLLLKPNEYKRVTYHRHCNLPFHCFDQASLTSTGPDLMSGSIVEIRDDSRNMIAIGFYEPQHGRVDVFHLTPKSSGTLPLVSEDYFMSKFHGAWETRRRLLLQFENNTYRIINGYADGLPSLFVDIFSESFARIIATSAGAERLVPAVAEYLRRKGAEQLLIDTPQLGCQRINVASPTVPMHNLFVEGGIRYQWLKDSFKVETVRTRFLVNSAHRRSRSMLRDLAKGKRVLCIYDRSGGASLNALLTAKRVTYVESDKMLYDWVTENFVGNHTRSVFSHCDMILADSLVDVSLDKQQDVVYMEHNPSTLSTASQWSATLSALIKNKIIGVGTILIMAQEAKPLGIEDLALRLSTVNGGLEPAATRKELAHLCRDAADSLGLRVRFLRAFAASYDHPLLPEDDSNVFALMYLFEGPKINTE